jgi:hypothetical protein
MIVLVQHYEPTFVHRFKLCDSKAIKVNGTRFHGTRLEVSPP